MRILIVDDHDVVHWGFRLMLSKQPWVERCQSARSGREAVELARATLPDVALVDLFLPGESGAEITARLRAAAPATRVLLMSGAGRISTAAARAAGASGFVPKHWRAPDIARAVRMVARGMTVFLADDADGGRGGEAIAPLSQREEQILELIAAGATNAEIADRLHLSPWTVKEYAGALYRKLSVRNRAEAVRRAQRLGLLA